MPRSLRRAAIALLIVLGPILGVMTWWRVTAPEPPLLPALDDLDPFVARLCTARIDTVHDSPRDAVAWAELAMVYHAHRFTDEAETCYRQALALDPDDAPCWYNLGRSRARRGEYEDAVACVDRAIALAPEYAPLHWERGEWLMELGRLEEAEASFRRTTEIAPTENAGVHGVARVYLQQRRYEDAVAVLLPLVGAAAARGDEDLYGRHLLSRAYRGLGRTEEADRMAQKSEVAPPLRYDPWAWYVGNLRTGYAREMERTEAMVQAGQTSEALEILLDIRATYGPEPRTLNAIAGAYAVGGQPHEAIRTLKELLASNPGHYRPYMNLASQYERIGNLDAAIEAVRAAISHTPNSLAMVTEGRLLLMKDDLAGAASAFERAIDAGSDHPENRVALANILDRLGRSADALVLYRSALDDDPDLASAHAGLAVALAGIAEFADAYRALERARELAPLEPAVEKAARRIAALERADG